MKIKDVREKLEALEGKSKTPVWKKRKRSQDKTFGLTPEQIEQVASQSKKDHILADELYTTDNHDLKYFGVCIDDPASYNMNDMSKRVKNLYLSPFGIKFCEEVVAHTFYAVQFVDRMAFDRHYQNRALGFTILSEVANQRTNLSEDYFKSFVRYICNNLEEEDDPEVRAEMIKAVVNIGRRNKRLFNRTMTAAKKVGPVEAKLNGTLPTKTDVAELLNEHSKYAQARH